MSSFFSSWKQYSFFIIIFSSPFIIGRAPNHYEHKTAHVRIGTTLCDDEITFLHKRSPLIKKNLEAVLETELSDKRIPVVAVACSGGGPRAMLFSLGSFDGFETPHSIATRHKNSFWHHAMHYMLDFLHYLNPEVDEIVVPQDMRLGLLNICTYATSLSGSTWALAGLIQSRNSVADYLAKLSTAINKSPLEDIDLDEVALVLLEKYSFEQPLSLIDVYGALLAQKILKVCGIENQNQIDLSDQRSRVEDAHVPLPIYTAITNDSKNPYSWIEFTPYEIGSVELNTFIPTWAFGRKFDNGISQDFNPPQSLGYFLGLWSSAVSANIKDFFDMYIQPLTGNILDAAIPDNTPLQTIIDYRISPAQVYNWTFNIAATPFNQDALLTLIDAGIDCNIPLQPLLMRERHVDIIIILDASNAPLGGELRKAENYARNHNLKFPPINYATIDQTCSVHKDSSDSSIPVIIYMPLMPHKQYQKGWNPWDEEFTHTLNYTYTIEQQELLTGLARYNMASSKKMILDTIKEWILAHNTTKPAINS